MSPAPPTPRLPRVSVVVVNYNAGPLLADCVRAVLASDTRVQLIVSDNGSTDGSVERVAALWADEPRLRILRNGANLGFAKANNLAFPLAEADYLLCLNPDCLVAPDTLSRMADVLDGRPEIGMAGCLVLDPDGSEQVACRRAIPDPWMAARDLFGPARLLATVRGRRVARRPPALPTAPVEVEAISGSFMFVRRRALESVGPLDEGYFLHCEDLDWFVRFARAGWGIALVPDARVVHHKGACSSGNPIAVERYKHQGMERFFRKHQYARYPTAFSALVVLGIRIHFQLVRLGLLAAQARLARGTP